MLLLLHSHMRQIHTAEHPYFKIPDWVTASVVWCSEFLATDPEVPGSIPGNRSE
jgi:hypothetical protein